MLTKADEVTQAAAVKALSERGIDNPAEIAGARDPVYVLSWCRWWDGQTGVGPGLLVLKIRSGEKPPVSKRELLDKEARYGLEVVEWLRKTFPEWNRPDGNRTHTAAIAAVLRLHQQHGKWKLSMVEHGPVIRETVRRFDAMFDDKEG